MTTPQQSVNVKDNNCCSLSIARVSRADHGQWMCLLNDITEFDTVYIYLSFGRNWNRCKSSQIWLHQKSGLLEAFRACWLRPLRLCVVWSILVRFPNPPYEVSWRIWLDPSMSPSIWQSSTSNGRASNAQDHTIDEQTRGFKEWDVNGAAVIIMWWYMMIIIWERRKWK